MAWLSSVAWTTGDTPVLATVLNNIGADVRTWGGNVDAGGNQLLNLSGVTLTSGIVKVGTVGGNIGSAGFFGLPADTGGGVLVARTGVANPYELWLGVNQATGFAEVQGAQAGVGFKNLILNRSGGNVGIGTASPTAKLHVTGLDTHASNAAAISAGKTAGAFYTDGAGNVKVVY